MKVLYDHQIFTWQRYGGISRYFYEIMRNLPPQIKIKNSTILSDNYYIKNNDIIKHHSIIPMKEFEWKKQLYSKVNKISSIITLKTSSYDIFHPTYYDPYFLKFIGNKPYVLTVHDLIHEKYPLLFSKDDITIKQKNKIICNATKIIAVSENTKKDIIDFYNVSSSKIEVIHHGFELKIEDKSISSKLKLPDRYVLFVGERNRYKNFDNFATALSILMRNDKFLYIVCTGIPFTIEEEFLLKKLKIIDRSIQYSVNDSELVFLYKNALAFIYPSLYEGFGIPILESFSNDCPVILSNASAFPEVADDSGVYFNPLNNDSICEAIRSVIYNEEVRRKLIEKGRKRLQQFSWKFAAKKTENVYKSIL